MALPSLDAFCDATVSLLTAHPEAAYPPTFVFDAETLALDALANSDPLHALQDQANRAGWHQLEFLFGVREDEDHVIVGHYDVGEVAFRRIRRRKHGFAIEAIDTPDWWWLSP